MGYKYFSANQPQMFITTGCYMINEIQENINENFYNSSTSFVILEEAIFASGSLTSTDVRINRGINTYTGEKLGDDFKYIMFKDFDHATGIGYKYFFDDNYWIVTNTEILKNLVSSCLVRRCNNVLRWVDEHGNLYNEPCVTEYKISRPRDQMSSINPTIPEGYHTITCQLNDRTNMIKPNQRFLFGNKDRRICYKIFGDGLLNFLNNKTLDDRSARLLDISAGGYFVNEDTDDLVDGYADRWLYVSSGSSNNVTFTPSDTGILESGSQVFNVKYSGSSGSFIFSLADALVPPANYIFTVVDGNNFSIKNNIMYVNNDLNIKCTGTSGSRIIPVHLRGSW